MRKIHHVGPKLYLIISFAVGTKWKYIYNGSPQPSIQSRSPQRALIWGPHKFNNFAKIGPAHIVTMLQDMDVDNDLGDVAESEKADSPKRSAKKIPLVV